MLFGRPLICDVLGLWTTVMERVRLSYCLSLLLQDLLCVLVKLPLTGTSE